jgi:hypothetical protein
MRKILLLAVVAAAFALPAAAWADSYLNGALVMRNGTSCGSCQFIIQSDYGYTWVATVGSVRTLYNNEAWDVPLQRIVMTETLNAQRWILGSGNYGCHYGSCWITVWARYPCPLGGYQYSPTKAGWASSAYPNYWESLIINTSIGCHTP